MRPEEFSRGLGGGRPIPGGKWVILAGMAVAYLVALVRNSTGWLD